MKAILAVNNLGFVGLDGELPWRNLEDFKHFKKLTMGDVLLVGYNTFQKLPELKGRSVLVDHRGNVDDSWTIIGDNVMHYEDLWCIGGKKTYEKYAPYLEELHISHIDDNTIGDTTFPDLIGLHPLCKVFNYHF